MKHSAPPAAPAHPAAPVLPAVAEIQGLYGPFTFPEKLLQKIWDRRDFDTHHTATADGRRVLIEHPGKWNHLGGPDFKNARLRIGDAALTGDVEVHLRETDWHAHQHATDPAYANVALHVVLFPPRRETTPGADARAIPILSLLPLLHHDLEQYATDDAIEHLAEHSLSRTSKKLAALPHAQLLETLALHAKKRWRQKVHYARLRIEQLGWDEACHHTALEILGYSRNRAAMLAIAGQYPLKNWVAHAGNPRNATATFAENIFSGHTWEQQAARPANHPRARLQQYAAWVSARPDWTQSLSALSKTLAPTSNAPANTPTTNTPTTNTPTSNTPAGSAPTGSTPADSTPADSTPADNAPAGSAPAGAAVASWRRANKAPALRKRIRDAICGAAIGGTRLDTLICDGFLPLLAAANPAGEPPLGAAWKNWFAGDMPAHFAKQLRALGATGSPGAPAHNGATQGLLGFLIEDETRA